MKKFLLLAIAFTLFAQLSAQIVSYSYKPLSTEGCKVEFSAVWQEGCPYIVVAITSDQLLFNDAPVITFKLFTNEVFKLYGQAISSTTSQAGLVMNNLILPITSQRAVAQFPITEEQLDKLQEGISKVRISTLPLTHERTFKKDKIGRKLYSFFKRNAHSEKNF